MALRGLNVKEVRGNMGFTRQEKTGWVGFLQA